MADRLPNPFKAITDQRFKLYARMIAKSKYDGANAGRVSTVAKDEWNNANFGWHCTLGFPVCIALWLYYCRQAFSPGNLFKPFFATKDA